MIITCPNCSTKYSINKTILGVDGKKVKCFDCGHEWNQTLDSTKKTLQTKLLKEKPILSNVHKEEIDVKRLFSSKIPKKKNYKFLYQLIPIILILSIYLNKKYFNYEIRDYYFKFYKPELLIIKINNNYDSFDLIFNQKEKEVSILNNNQKVIKIYGKISNISDMRNHKIPKLQATLLDSKNNVITSWFFYADKEDLEPQESINFTTSYINDKQDISDIKIEFYKENE